MIPPLTTHPALDSHAGLPWRRCTRPVFPQSPGQPPKRRPALVVQSDQNNARLANSIFAMITSNTRLAQSEPTQVLVDIDSAEGRGSGLAQTSAVKCENIHTLPQAAVVRVIGRLPPTLLQAVDAALLSALALR